MTSMQTDDLIVTELLESLETPCDFSDHWSCSKGRAEWVLHRVRCECGVGGAVLACDGCKNDRLSSESAVECGKCGEVTAPARAAYSYIEYLNRRPQ